jgi:hypothetical protein
VNNDLNGTLDTYQNETRSLAIQRARELGVLEEYIEIVWSDFLKFVAPPSFTERLSRLRASHKHFFVRSN